MQLIMHETWMTNAYDLDKAQSIRYSIMNMKCYPLNNA